jgi:hypothetical protein
MSRRKLVLVYYTGIEIGQVQWVLKHTDRRTDI